MGGVDSQFRPQDRADVAQFYAATAPVPVWNAAASQVAVEQGRSMSENARALALVNMAISDAQASVFETKYHYNFWRPETAIRAGNADGNPLTRGDPDFKPFVITPCFPSYASGHGSSSGAAREVLERLFGARHHFITLSNPAVAGVVLQYGTFRQITRDIDDARVYGGIHFRFDQEAGAKLGRQVGAYVHRNTLRRTHGARTTARQVTSVAGSERRAALETLRLASLCCSQQATTMRQEYGQFCPVALASEVLAERWTLLVVRELARRRTTLQRHSSGRAAALGDAAQAATSDAGARRYRRAEDVRTRTGVLPQRGRAVTEVCGDIDRRVGPAMGARHPARRSRSGLARLDDASPPEHGGDASRQNRDPDRVRGRAGEAEAVLARSLRWQGGRVPEGPWLRHDSARFDARAHTRRGLARHPFGEG